MKIEANFMNELVIENKYILFANLRQNSHGVDDTNGKILNE